MLDQWLMNIDQEEIEISNNAPPTPRTNSLLHISLELMLLNFLKYLMSDLVPSLPANGNIATLLDFWRDSGSVEVNIVLHIFITNY